MSEVIPAEKLYYLYSIMHRSIKFTMLVEQKLQEIFKNQIEKEGRILYKRFINEQVNRYIRMEVGDKSVLPILLNYDSYYKLFHKRDYEHQEIINKVKQANDEYLEYLPTEERQAYINAVARLRFAILHDYYIDNELNRLLRDSQVQADIDEEKRKRYETLSICRKL